MLFQDRIPRQKSSELADNQRVESFLFTRFCQTREVVSGLSIKDKPLGPNRSRGFCLSVAEKIKPRFLGRGFELISF